MWFGLIIPPTIGSGKTQNELGLSADFHFLYEIFFSFSSDIIFRFVNVRSLAWHNFYLQAIKHLGPRPLMSLKALFGRRRELCINRSEVWACLRLFTYLSQWPSPIPIPIPESTDHTQRNSSPARFSFFFLHSSGQSVLHYAAVCLDNVSRGRAGHGVLLELVKTWLPFCHFSCVY